MIEVKEEIPDDSSRWEGMSQDSGDDDPVPMATMMTTNDTVTVKYEDPQVQSQYSGSPWPVLVRAVPQKSDSDVDIDFKQKMVDVLSLGSRSHNKCPLEGSSCPVAELKELSEHSLCSQDCHRDVDPPARNPSRSRPFRCPHRDCQKTYTCGTALRIHIRMKHEKWKFKCDFPNCGKKFPLKTTLLKHQKRHSPERKFDCEKRFCFKSFKTAEELRRHMKLHAQDRPYHCVVEGCDLAFKYPKSVDTHIASAHPGPHHFPCTYPKCGKSYSKLLQLRKHSQVHSSDKFVCPHPSCSQSFSTDYYLRSHLWKKHGKSERTLACPQCPRTFKSQKRLAKHLDDHQDGHQEACTCQHCGKVLANRQTLRRHLECHSNERPYVCDKCGVSFKRKYTLQKHSKRHTAGSRGSAACLCPLCGIVTDSKTELNAHLRTHKQGGQYSVVGENKGPVFVCPEENCGKTFKSAKYLSEHRVIHFPESHICSVCGKVFKCLRYLRSHCKTHSEERCHICRCCGKGFKTYKEMIRHAEIHEGSRKYKCTRPGCGRAYKTAGTLRIHLRRIHEKNESLNRDVRNYSFDQGHQEPRL